MKKILFILIVPALMFSCSKGSGSDSGSSVTNPPANILTVDIEGYGASHIWSSDDCFGIYGSKKGDNVRYVVETTSFEQDGQTRIYGTGAEGEVTGYYPYSAEGYPAVAEGRQPLFSAQTFMESAEEQLKAHTVLVAKVQDERLSFTYRCGVLHLHMTTDIAGPVTSAVLTSASKAVCGELEMFSENPAVQNPGSELELSGINRPCSLENPLDVRFMLPPGTYSDLQITLISDAETIMKPVEATLTIEPKSEVRCTISNKETIYEGSDIIIIEGRFDD